MSERSGTYKCAACHREFEYNPSWSNEDALAEKDQIFGSVPAEDCDIVCDDCFKILTGDVSAIAHFNIYHNPALQGSESCSIP